MHLFLTIGSYLMTKCTHYPESLDACKILIDRYEENDLYNVYAALNDAIVDRTDASIIRGKDEMEEILDNIWNDTTIKNFTTAFSWGMDITCGIIGYCLGSITGIGGQVGFLGSLGLKVIDSGTSKFIDEYSELISKKIASPYMATVYDFKKEISGTVKLSANLNFNTPKKSNNQPKT